MSMKSNSRRFTNSITLSGLYQRPSQTQMSLEDGFRNMKQKNVGQLKKKIISTEHTFLINDDGDENNDIESIASSQESHVEVRPLKFSFRNQGDASTYELEKKLGRASIPAKPKEIMTVNKPVSDGSNIFTMTQAGLPNEDLSMFESNSERAFSPITPIGTHKNADCDVTIEYYDPSTSIPADTPLTRPVNIVNQTIIPSGISKTLNITPPRGTTIVGMTLQLEGCNIQTNRNTGTSQGQAINENRRKSVVTGHVNGRENNYCQESRDGSGLKRPCPNSKRGEGDKRVTFENGSTSGVTVNGSLAVAKGASVSHSKRLVCPSTSGIKNSVNDKEKEGRCDVTVRNVRRALFGDGSDASKGGPKCSTVGNKTSVDGIHKKVELATQTHNSTPPQRHTDNAGISGLSQATSTNKPPELPVPAKGVPSVGRNINESNSSNHLNEASTSSKSVSTPEKNTPSRPVITPKKTNPPSTSKSPKKRAGPSLDTSSISSPKKTKTENERTPNMGLVKILINLLLEVLQNVHLKNLLTEEKKVFWEFKKLDGKSKYVVLKLFTFKRKWYSVSKFCDRLNLGLLDNKVIDLYHNLRDIGFIETDCANETIDAALYFLEPSKLQSICKRLRATPKVKSKECMVQTLLKMCRQQSTLTASRSITDILREEIMKHMGYSMRLKESVHDAFYRAYTLGTFTNNQIENPSDYFFLAQKLQDRVTVFPQYPVEDYMVFYTRGWCLSYIEAKKLKEEFYETDQKKYLQIFAICQLAFEKLKKLIRENNSTTDPTEIHQQAPHLRRYTAESAYTTIISKAVRSLTTRYPEKVKDWLEFLIEACPTSSRISEWYGNLAWLHMRYLKPTDNEKAADLLIEVLEQRGDSISERAMLEMIDKCKLLLSGKNKISQLSHDRLVDLLPAPINDSEFTLNPIDAQTVRGNTSSRKRDYVKTDVHGNKTFRKVEEVALEHYAENGYPEGCHCEGGTMKALFVLYFWDIIYNPETVVPATFLSRIQNAPLDMFTEHFYPNRRDLIDKRLSEISSEWSEDQLIRFAMSNWESHANKHSVYGEIRHHLSLEKLTTVLSCISRSVLAKIFERLVKNVGRLSSGMPDLLLWNSEQRVVKFVEVKGEGDKLSVTQKLWLKYLQDIGAYAEVCHVHSIGSKRKSVKKSKQSNADEASASPENT